MKYITADYIFPVSSPPIKNGIIVVDDDGSILDILPVMQNAEELTEKHNGIICPGFINAHCHLELSYLKGKISEQSGLTGFIEEFIAKRGENNTYFIEQCISHAESEMIANGIVAVGDISNNDSTFRQKNKGNLFYHTFLEVFDLIPSRAREVFENAKRLNKSIASLSSSITPHAPYSVSQELFQLINTEATRNNALLSIHNQETKSENDLFKTKTGLLYEFFKKLNNPLTHIPITKKNSLPSYLPLLPTQNKILLVHNTFADESDIAFAHQYSKNIYWCLCPNANLYIENATPDFNLFITQKTKCCIGTDSYASNWGLSVLDELKTITNCANNIPLQTLLEWGTINGAGFLGIQHKFGSIEKNKQPGLNLIQNVDMKNLCLTKQSSVKKIS